jgi:hypothetical protein
MTALIGVPLLLPVVMEEPWVLLPDEELLELEVSRPSCDTELAQEFLELAEELMMIKMVGEIAVITVGITR